MGCPSAVDVPCGHWGQGGEGSGRLLGTHSSVWLRLVNMPELEKSLFTGENEPPDDLGKYEVTNFNSDVDEILRKTGWKGKVYGCIGLQLSPDNIRVNNGTFFVRGTLDEKDVKIGCNKVWAEADMSTTITIRIPTSESFTFGAGGLWSDWLPGEETVHYYHSVTDGGPPTPASQQIYANGESASSVSGRSATSRSHPSSGES